jgi:hypothetical protein
VTMHSAIDQDKTRLLLHRFGVLATFCNYPGRSMLRCAGSTRTCDRLPRRSFRVEPLTAAAQEAVGLGCLCLTDRDRGSSALLARI